MNKFHVTLSGLRKAGACVSGYNKVVRALQGKDFTKKDEERKTHIRFAHKYPIRILSIVESNGLDDALWSLRCIENSDKDKDVRLFAVWCARQVQGLMKDQRSIDALDVSERYANGCATDEELYAARDAAWAAARDAAWYAAWDAARDAARGAAWDAARAAARAAAALDTSWYSAWAAALDAQKTRLIEMLEKGSFN